MMFLKNAGFLALFIIYAKGSFVDNFKDYLTSYISQRFQGNDDFNVKEFNDTFQIHKNGLRLKLWTEGLFRGLANFEVNEINVTPDLNITINCTLHNTGVVSSYDLKGYFHDVIPLEGNGSFELTLINFKFYVNAKILPQGGFINMASFDLHYDFDDFKVIISGLTKHDDVDSLLEIFIKDATSILLKKLKKYIEEEIRDFVMNNFKSSLQKMNLKDIMEFVKRFI